MKNRATFLPIILASVCALAASGCSEGKSVLLGEPAVFEPLSYTEREAEDFKSYRDGAQKFFSSFTAYACENLDDGKNYAVSPVSAYSALALAAECAAGQTRAEILTALNASYAELTANFSSLYRMLNVTHTSYSLFGEKTTGMLRLGNSVWVDSNVEVNAPCVENLSEKFLAYSYSADFFNDNAQANKAVQSFVKNQTEGLIDCEFNLPKETVFTLINCLYLKDIWNEYGDDLSFTDENYKFKNPDGTETNLKLLTGDYRFGRAYEGAGFKSFYTRTHHGYKIKFILPDGGVSAREIMTSENLALVNALSDYNGTDHAAQTHYYTRCLFPEFKASYDGSLNDILKNKFNLNSLFDTYGCDFSNLYAGKAVCGEIRHVTDLTVDKKGIEGAAVTIIPAASAAGPDGYETVYLDFTIDRSFGFILTDWDDIPLFSGIINAV